MPKNIKEYMEKQNIYKKKKINCKEVRFLITLGIIREEELIQDICFIHKIKMSYRLNEKKKKKVVSK